MYFLSQNFGLYSARHVFVVSRLISLTFGLLELETSNDPPTLQHSLNDYILVAGRL
jgi:hypothetical protein